MKQSTVTGNDPDESRMHDAKGRKPDAKGDMRHTAGKRFPGARKFGGNGEWLPMSSGYIMGVTAMF